MFCLSLIILQNGDGSNQVMVVVVESILKYYIHVAQSNTHNKTEVCGLLISGLLTVMQSTHPCISLELKNMCA